MKKHIAIVTGGNNGEREISLKSANTFFDNLDSSLYDVDLFDTSKNYNRFLDEIKKFTIVIPVIHGIGGEDGEITSICEKHNIPYFFTTSISHRLCIDKYRCSKHIEKQGIKIPQTHIIENNNFILLDGDTVFIKPVHGGSSIDSGICTTQNDVDTLIKKINVYDQALVQEYITGREFTVSIVGDWDGDIECYAISEIITQEAFFDYNAKYNLKNTKEITPAQVSQELEDKIKKISKDIYRYCQLTCLARIDYIYNTEKDILYFLEVNTIPGFTETSFFPQAIRCKGLSISEFLDNTISKILNNRFIK